MSQHDARQRIQQAMLELLGEKPYSQITMTELANFLGITRQNVYRYYSSKEQIFTDLMYRSFETMADNLELFGKTSFQPSLTDWDAYLELQYTVLLENKLIMCRLLTSDAGDLVFKITKTFISRLLGHIARVSGIRILNQAYFDLIVLHITGSSYHTIKAWAEDGMSLPLKDMTYIQKQIFDLPTIINLLRKCDGSS